MKRTIDIHNRMIEEAKAGAKGDDYTMFTGMKFIIGGLTEQVLVETVEAQHVATLLSAVISETLCSR
jgi:hypothetical protein